MQLGGMADKPAIAALQQKIEALDKQQSEQAASVTALKNGLSSFQEQIRTLNQRPANVAAVVPAVTSGTVVVKKKPIPKAQRPVTAPFVLTGIERRGGIAFAAIAPQSATQLTEIALMEPGKPGRAGHYSRSRDSRRCFVSRANPDIDGAIRRSG